jgi:hypothetical protein
MLATSLLPQVKDKRQILNLSRPDDNLLSGQAAMIGRGGSRARDGTQASRSARSNLPHLSGVWKLTGRRSCRKQVDHEDQC